MAQYFFYLAKKKKKKKYVQRLEIEEVIYY